MNEELKNFVKNFFLNCGSEVKEENELLYIKKIPKEVKDYLGKEEPYIFSIDKFIDEKAEVITKGSFIFKVMNDYLKNKGQTSILKIDFSNKIENITIPIVLKECVLFRQEKKEIIDKFVRFTFSTDFQYLNDREQILKDVFVKDGKIMNFFLDKLKLVEGNSKEVNYDNIKEDYILAKNSIKSELKDKIESVSEKLKNKLEKELERINKHYDSQKSEINKKISRLNIQLQESIKDKDEKKINKLSQEIKELNLKLDDKITQVEKNFFIQDEINKHSLNLKTNLINTSIIYYYNYRFNLHIKNEKAIRLLILDFDPFNNKISDVYCDSCKSALKQIFLCNSGHVICFDCTENRCLDCNSLICKICMKKKCVTCNRLSCKRCSKNCFICLNSICKNHSNIEKSTQKVVCNNCSKVCSKCKNYFIKDKINNKGLCSACVRLSSISIH